MTEFRNNISTLLLRKKYWFIHFWIVSIISIAGLVFMGGATYMGAPPVPDFKTSTGNIIVSADEIMAGQELFHLRGLMNYGSFWGDGAERGPDFTAESLHAMTVAMKAYYAEQINPHAVTQNDSLNQWQFDIPVYDQHAIESQIKTELHNNTYNENTNVATISDAQIYGIQYLNSYYTRMFTDAAFPEAFHPINYISNPQQLKELTAFFY